MIFTKRKSKNYHDGNETLYFVCKKGVESDEFIKHFKLGEIMFNNVRFVSYDSGLMYATEPVCGITLQADDANDVMLGLLKINLPSGTLYFDHVPSDETLKNYGITRR